MLLTALSGACAGGSSGVLPDGACPGTIGVPNGTWGGERIMLETRDAGALLEYDCAHGTIAEPLLLDRDGTFHAEGIHVIENVGPQRADEQPATHPALYTGQVEDNTMTLTVRLTDTEEEIGTFTLVRGQVPRITKCL